VTPSSGRYAATFSLDGRRIRHRYQPASRRRPGSMTPLQPLPRMDPGLRRGAGDGGIDHGLSPSPQPRPYSSSPRRGGGRLVPARCGGGEWSSGTRRRGRKPPYRACAGVPSARSWAAVRAVRRGRAGRVRDKRVNSPARPGPAGERPRGAPTFVETAHDYPYAGRRPGAPPPPRPSPARAREAAKPCGVRDALRAPHPDDLSRAAHQPSSS
jgi:hypothetical protein